MVDNRRATTRILGMLRASQMPGELDVVDYPSHVQLCYGVSAELAHTAPKDAPDLRGLAGGLRGIMRQHNQHAWAGEIAL